MNKSFIFRCRPITEESMVTFFKDNHKFVGVHLGFLITERKLERNPIREEAIVHSKVEIRWTGMTTLEHQGEVCGKKYSGQLAVTL